MKIKIDQVMTSQIETIQESEGLKSAYLKMKLHGIRHLPVINSQDQVVGIISDRDVQRSMMCFDSGQFDFSPDDEIRKYMSSDIKSVPHTSGLIDVVENMIAHQISAVLITESDCLIGIITHEDLLLVLADLLQPSKPRRSKKLPLHHVEKAAR